MRKIVDIKNKPNDPAVRELLERIARGEDRIRVGGLEGSGRAFLPALLFHHLRRPLIVIVPEEKEAEAWLRDLSFFLDDSEALLLPSWDLLTTDMFAFQRETELSRLEALHRLLYGPPAVVVASARGLMQRLPPREVIEGVYRMDLRRGHPEAGRTRREADRGGYGRVSLVEGRGEFSVRGNVVDLFPRCRAGRSAGVLRR